MPMVSPSCRDGRVRSAMNIPLAAPLKSLLHLAPSTAERVPVPPSYDADTTSFAHRGLPSKCQIAKWHIIARPDGATEKVE